MEAYKKINIEEHKAPTGELVFIQSQAENQIMNVNMAIKSLKDNLNHLISEIDGVLSVYEGSNKQLLSSTRNYLLSNYDEISKLQGMLISDISTMANNLVSTNKATSESLQGINQRLQVISNNLM